MTDCWQPLSTVWARASVVSVVILNPIWEPAIVAEWYNSPGKVARSLWLFPSANHPPPSLLRVFFSPIAFVVLFHHVHESPLWFCSGPRARQPQPHQASLNVMTVGHFRVSVCTLSSRRRQLSRRPSSAAETASVYVTMSCRCVFQVVVDSLADRQAPSLSLSTFVK